MRLSELNPTFIKVTDPELNLQENTDNIEEANGITFDCPQCTKKILCWQPKTLWRFKGSGYNDLTLKAETPIYIECGCGYHFTINDGEIASHFLKL